MSDRSTTARRAADRRGTPRAARLPAGLTPQQEADWWDAHPDYWDQQPGGAPDDVVAPASSPAARRTRPINLRLPVDLIEALKREAARRDLPYQTLIRVWLREQLDRHQTDPAPARVAESKPPYGTRKRAG
ncbi:MAG TPA: CopG family antitoxin [Chloroflexota bacterium]|nr:CopG family antitoxin [Chloroflexota bacterium]